MWEYLKLIPLLILCHDCSALRACTQNELCITELRCNETDDSGRGLLGPRSLDSSCGIGLVCCDKAQLESFEATIAQRQQQQTRLDKQSKPVEPKTTIAPINLDFKLDYDTCDTNKLCVPRHLCRSGMINEDGRYLIRPRIDGSSNFGCMTLESCCPITDQLNESEDPMLRNLRDFKYKGCGHSNPNGLYYDFVGYKNHEASYAEYPWMVALTDMQANYVCGGTLIHPQVVLTSAHNVANHSSDSLLARAGEFDLSSQREPHPYQTRRLRYLWRHELFNKLNFHNDIALLVLEQPFQLAPHIQPLCLPPVETSLVQGALREAQCFALGWGNFNATAKSMDRILKRIDLPILEHQHCQTLLRRTILGRRFKLHQSFICAGGVEGKDTCQGDGGSPLFCSIAGQPNRFQMAGIVSWGIECAEKDIPAAYTNVPHLRSWIDEQLTKLGFKMDEF
ncbi:phenoloxidase-activating factor 2 [Drosophila innubila]|uniref:phenoloxidase-activating factor 2 n=1 Tax=Drosophila innubila TaxID=198719 RepID=UPI00148D02C7|nr:phenoloxidase-activating factor 2 [Drosophila innubila]XP_034477194.1 phenoloxidase-activating factor 2 [Drosophila innubila]